MSEIEALRRRLDALEKENAKLKQAPAAAEKPLTTVVGSWKGNPILTFEGPFRPFSIGLRKASVILAKMEDLRFFVDNNKHRMKKTFDEPDA